jgi:hypothetical protein
MQHRHFDWHEDIKDVENEYRAARIAVPQRLLGDVFS